jgi:hypothetical protein
LRLICIVLCLLVFIPILTACGKEETAAEAGSAGIVMQKVKETDGFVYYCVPDDAEIADEIGALMEEKRPEINRLLGYDYDGKITVQIYPDQKSFDESSAGRGMQGSPAFSDKGFIAMVSPDSPIKVMLSYEERLMMAVHEYVHIVLDEINGDMPMWMNEGLASYLGSADGYDSICQFAFPRLGEISFNELWNSYNELPAPDVYSCSAVRFIIERFGYDKINELLRDPGSFENILSTSMDDFNVLWNDYINENFKNG